MDLPSAVITDLDGTLSIATSRRYSDFYNVHLDTPDPIVLEILHHSVKLGRKIIAITGRPDFCKEATQGWIQDVANIPLELLLMRDREDLSPDTIVKRELYIKHIAGKYAIDLVLEDKPSVVKMWREEGLRCYEVANNE